MEFKRIDETTVRCIVTEEDMQEYDVEIDDFLKNNSKVTEFLHNIVELAVEEVGYKPDKGMLAMQVMPLPKNRLAITFSESEEAGIGDMIGQLKDIVSELGEIVPEDILERFSDMSDDEKVQSFDKFMKKAIEDAAQEKEEDKYRNKKLAGSESIKPKKIENADTSTKKNKKNADNTSVIEKEPSYLRIYKFDSFEDVEQYAKTIPEKVNIISNLYKDEFKKEYYLVFEKGRVSRVNFESMCNKAIEYSTYVSDNSIRLAYLNEHFKLMIRGKAIKILRNL